MGTDIHGFVECRATFGTLDEEDAAWHAAISLDLLYGGRDYDAFGCLFGVRNYAGFRPIAEGRGLPGDVSAQTRDAYETWEPDCHSSSWASWAELDQVDWDESADTVDERVHQYTFTPDHGRVLTGKSFQDIQSRPERAEWTQGDVLYRVVRMIRRDAIAETSEWTPVWMAMQALADVHGSENVRLVVWFDN
ncbi:hypothetical protein AB8O64_00090 [Streptomyces sp. QH1-20]|uniref:hypothetical protein n=1 Tax=Streptomyces sp. QH1-20 TaxID=3240934 RepID=UPI003513B429